MEHNYCVQDNCIGNLESGTLDIYIENTLIKDVPAEICVDCGEGLLSKEVYQKVSSIDMKKKLKNVEFINYQDLL